MILDSAGEDEAKLSTKPPREWEPILVGVAVFVGQLSAVVRFRLLETEQKTAICAVLTIRIRFPFKGDVSLLMPKRSVGSNKLTSHNCYIFCCLTENGGYDAGMKVTAKVRKVRSNRQGEHYLFKSRTHEIDERAARKRRAKVFVQVGELEKPKKAFPKAKEVCSVGVRVEPPKGGSGKASFELATEEEFLKGINEARQPSAGVYFVPHASKTKKDGSPVMQKRRTDALSDAYFSMPPWYAEFFAAVIDSRPEMSVVVMGAAFRAAAAAAAALEERTGYEPVSLAVHPDGETALGFHIQFRKIRDGKLLGRSACGDVGRKGLRLAGDVNLALHRFDAVEVVPGSWKKVVEERDYDDVAMDVALLKALDLEVEAIAGKDGVEYVRSMAKDYVREWKGKTEIAGRIERAEMEARLEKVEKHLGKVSQELSGFSSPDEPTIA